VQPKLIIGILIFWFLGGTFSGSPVRPLLISHNLAQAEDNGQDLRDGTAEPGSGGSLTPISYLKTEVTGFSLFGRNRGNIKNRRL